MAIYVDANGFYYDDTGQKYKRAPSTKSARDKAIVVNSIEDVFPSNPEPTFEYPGYGTAYIEAVARGGSSFGYLEHGGKLYRVSGKDVQEVPSSDPTYTAILRSKEFVQASPEQYLASYFPEGELREDLRTPPSAAELAQNAAQYEQYKLQEQNSRTGVTAARYSDADLRALRESGQLVEGGTGKATGTSGPGSLGAPVTRNPQGTGGSGMAQFQPTGDPQLDATLSSLQGYIEELEKRGQVLNPNIKIDEATIAKFTKQAEAEINPFYATQLKLARENLLTNAGYSRDEILRNEEDLERQYKTAFRGIGESAADQGFALSGLRQRDEGELARTTNEAIGQGRRQLNFQTGQDARGFAQQWGGRDMPDLSIGEAPSVGSGELAFNRGGQSRSLYSLDPNIYDSLVGEQEFNRRGAVKNRTSELESAFRSNQGLTQQRSLIL